MSHIVHRGDCLDPATGLASLPDKSVDHVICDPPYSEHVHANQQSGDGAKVKKYRDLGFAALTPEQMVGVAAASARAARRWVLVFCDVESATDWRAALSAAGLDYVRIGAWIKPGSAPQFSGDRPAVGYESIVIAHQPGRKRWNGGGRSGVWTTPIVSGERLHTTQKPEPLMEALVRDFTDPGETILDPFAGSGTTGVACKRLGRSFIGWERDARYHAIATKRIAGTREQFGLFAEGA